MKVLVRRTLTGSEYWCTKEKRILFVPKGETPKFKVTDNPKSMVVSVEEQTDETEVQADETINLEEMNATELLAFAKNEGINVPGNMKKEETIRNHIAEQM